MSFLQLWDLRPEGSLAKSLKSRLCSDSRLGSLTLVTMRLFGRWELRASTSENFGGYWGRRYLGAGQTHPCHGSEAIQFLEGRAELHTTERLDVVSDRYAGAPAGGGTMVRRMRTVKAPSAIVPPA